VTQVGWERGETNGKEGGEGALQRGEGKNGLSLAGIRLIVSGGLGGGRNHITEGG